MPLLTLVPNLQMGGSEVSQPTLTLNTDTAYEVYIKQQNGAWQHTQIVFTGTDFGVVR